MTFIAEDRAKEWDETKKKGIEHIERALLAGADNLNALEIPFILVGGTLLGIIREGHVLAHDKDIDVAVLIEDLTEAKRSSLCRSIGFIHNSAGHAGSGQFAYDYDGIHFDIFIYILNGKYRVTDPSGRGCLIFPKHLFEKNRWGKINYLDREWNTPSDPIEFIEYMYGKEWKTPIYVYSWKDAPNFRGWEDIE